MVLLKESLMTFESHHPCHHPGFGFCGPSAETSQSLLHVGAGGGVGEENTANPGGLQEVAVCMGPALACLLYKSRCAGSIFGQLVWLFFSCMHYVPKATQRERENIQALARLISSLESISDRSLRGCKVSVLYLRRCR